MLHTILVLKGTAGMLIFWLSKILIKETELYVAFYEFSKISFEKAITFWSKITDDIIFK